MWWSRGYTEFQNEIDALICIYYSFWNFTGARVLCGSIHPYLQWKYWWYTHMWNINRPENFSNLIYSRTRYQTGFKKGYIETAENLLETF